MATISDDLQMTAGHSESNSQSREVELLLAVAKPRPGEDDLSRLTALVRPDLNWAFLLLAAHRHGLLPLLYSRLNRHASGGLPPHIQDQLALIARTNGRRVADALDEHERLLRVLTAAGIGWFPLRTPGIHAYYDKPEERQLEPIELLVDPGDAIRSLGILLANGYRRVHPLSGACEHSLLHDRYLPLHNTERNVRLHLQARSLPRFIDGSATHRALERVLGPRNGNRTASAPAEVLLLQACLYGSVHGWSKLAWVADVSAIVERGDIDWSEVLASANGISTRRMLYLGLQLAKDLLDTSIPPELQELMAADPKVEVLAQRIESGFRHDLRGYTQETERLRHRLQLMATRKEKTRFAVRFALTPDVEDLKPVSLPRPLMPAYAVLRPMRLLGLTAARLAQRIKRAPYYSTEVSLVEQILHLAGVGPGDTVYDLGCGDGRVVIAAAKLGARAVGIDLRPDLLAQARANAREAGVEHLTSFEQTDLTLADVSEATVVFAWLSPALNLALRPRLQATLRPGSRVVTHSFDMGDWLPDLTSLVADDDDHVVLAFLWNIPPPAAEKPSPTLALTQ